MSNSNDTNGIGQVFESMFDTFGKYRPGPSAEELKSQMEAATRISKVIFKQYVVRSYVLSVPDDVIQYSKDMTALIDGSAKRTHVLFNKNKEFVPTHATGATWIVNMEWGEFELKEELVDPTSAESRNYEQVIPAHTGSAD